METKALNRQLKLLNRNLEKLNSPVRRFMLGVIAGIGSAIGATIFAGLILLLLSQFVRSLEDIPILKQIIDAIADQEYTRLN